MSVNGIVPLYRFRVKMRFKAIRSHSKPSYCFVSWLVLLPSPLRGNVA